MTRRMKHPSCETAFLVLGQALSLRGFKAAVTPDAFKLSYIVFNFTRASAGTKVDLKPRVARCRAGVTVGLSYINRELQFRFIRFRTSLFQYHWDTCCKYPCLCFCCDITNQMAFHLCKKQWQISSQRKVTRMKIAKTWNSTPGWLISKLSRPNHQITFQVPFSNFPQKSLATYSI